MAARNVDRESGKNRVSARSSRVSRRGPPQAKESSYDDALSSDTDLESDLEMPAKDDSRRKGKDPAPARRLTRKDGRSNAIKGAEPDETVVDTVDKPENGTKVAPHMAILIAATYHFGLSSIARPSTSSFIPSAYNFFFMLNEMCSLLSHNSLLHEMCPEFFTPAITLYYAHVFFFQVLRARAAAGSDVLSRLEKRVLTFYERIGPAESWPVASPLLGFLEYLGAHKPEDPMFGWIVPALPDFMQYHAASPTCLANSNRVNGISRIPLVPALQKVLYAFAHDENDFENGLLRPVGDNTLSATNVFCGITTSGVTSDRFASIAGNLAWFAPPETGDSVGPWDYDVKRNRLRRWNIPDVPDNADLSSLASFLGFTDNQGFDWMRQLLSMSGVFNRFFPGSGNLSQVSPLSTIGMATMVKYNRLTGISRIADTWYYPRSSLKLSSQGFTNTDAGLLDTKMSITCSWNSEYSTANATRVSVAPDLTLSPCRNGPFFNDDPAFGLTERKATIITENYDQVDPCRRFLELITPMYDPKGGR